jgi:hypothetical protein
MEMRVIVLVVMVVGLSFLNALWVSGVLGKIWWVVPHGASGLTDETLVRNFRIGGIICIAGEILAFMFLARGMSQ